MIWGKRFSAACALLIIMSSSHCKETPVEPAPLKHPTPAVRIGWQTAWAGQGQIIQAMQHTNIPSLYGANLQFRDFLFGPDLNEAAVTGNIDVTNAGIVPVVNLLAANDDWIIIGRQVDFLVSIVARDGSGVKTVADLKGKKFGIPIGGGSHPYALQSLAAAGLRIGDGKDAVEVINVKPSEMALAIKQGAVDAVASWEPTTTLAVANGGKVIDEKRYVGFIMVRRSYAQAHRDAIAAMLKAYVEANYYVATHRADCDAWFAKVSGIKPELLSRLKDIEPNFKASNISGIRLAVAPDDVTLSQEVARVMFSGGMVKKQVLISERLDMSYAQEALAGMQPNGYSTTIRATKE
jgi:sulfonate transport system substrate-binding protein